MKDIGIDIDKIVTCFTHQQTSPYIIVEITKEQTDNWVEDLAVPLRRCYIEDSSIEYHSNRTGESRSDIVASKLPDRGSIMSGDFGEILGFLYHCANNHPEALIGPKKWRLKQDRNKPAPYSDVVQFIIPKWPQSTDQDCILCSEVKAKATSGATNLISEAIVGCKKDRKDRLTKTLVWLRERAKTEDIGSVSIELLNRFINATDHPSAIRIFFAVVVVCSEIFDQVIKEAPVAEPIDYTLIAISVPDLKSCYELVYDAIHASVEDPEVIL